MGVLMIPEPFRPQRHRAAMAAPADPRIIQLSPAARLHHARRHQLHAAAAASDGIASGDFVRQETVRLHAQPSNPGLYTSYDTGSQCGYLGVERSRFKV